LLLKRRVIHRVTSPLLATRSIILAAPAVAVVAPLSPPHPCIAACPGHNVRETAAIASTAVVIQEVPARLRTPLPSWRKNAPILGAEGYVPRRSRRKRGATRLLSSMHRRQGRWWSSRGWRWESGWGRVRLMHLVLRRPLLRCTVAWLLLMTNAEGHRRRQSKRRCTRRTTSSCYPG
jgi:hypothetical protein